MDQPQKKSYKLVWIAAASFVVFIVVVSVVFVLVSGSTKKTDQTAANAAASKADVASKSDIEQHLSDLGTNLKQAAKDQASLKTTLSNSKNQTKLGN